VQEELGRLDAVPRELAHRCNIALSFVQRSPVISRGDECPLIESRRFAPNARDAGTAQFLDCFPYAGCSARGE
jgi:hypothetical protein